MVETYSEIYNLLDVVYDKTTAEIIKETTSTTTEETRCAGFPFCTATTMGINREKNLSNNS